MTKNDAQGKGPKKDGKELPYDPDTPLEEREGATSAMLKDDIASGRTGDKQGFPDPGAAPLGTGAEAAGQPSTREQMETAREQETARPSDRVSDDERRPVTPDGPGGDDD
ncbi:hypothetical protein [Jannaschia aquimarina]|uniref:Uncharacterized protein n=1 Tax=Jannaschia aquimarina TaxID=935700 RepID=A0A0D1EMV2_9RHOB|nr:hypothetical protein [Jannaschia aquimarina]KIT17030.1 hypothetical protein jaqu_12200 [Jannaschia aquimarina]SNS81840.1 hypothetical protein SAMN05421775_102423 [Jannaschia aquimarina]